MGIEIFCSRMPVIIRKKLIKKFVCPEILKKLTGVLKSLAYYMNGIRAERQVHDAD